ncbi:hypothetical protein P691DRAFT_725262 [Macrolepiota fuliginosa MF-IS2]|uniref:Uncharacterized protein n=1 Tax=Macrolepiota fuliginosa MF-IS2 TaxID=1400762 RepID=A0A9P6C706_9AGAR|nr:hypothetical protein P691DRAFT_725262 [Macrolepiota fuliginosa MF-IS2]
MSSPTNFVGPPTPLPPEVAHIVAIWTEVLLYGVYTCLFLEASYIMLRKRRENIASARVFLITTFLMYILSTAHIVLGLYRMLRAYVWRVEPPAWYFMDFRNWDTVAHNAMLCTMTWLGDALVIYRCWVVWNYNYWVIVIPIILLIFEFASNTMLLVWFTHFGMASPNAVLSWMATIYPLVFVQNIITTGLIGFKIWTQHRSSTANGVIDTSSRLSLVRIFRIVVESAAIYTFQILVLLILYPMQHNAQFIVQSAVIPSIGIVFVLIAVRVHLNKSTTFFTNTTPISEIPNWFESDANSTHSMPTATGSSSATGQPDREKYGNSVDLIPSAGNLLHQV